MSITLTQDEIDALNAEYCRLQASVAKRAQAIIDQQDSIGEAEDADAAQDKVFNLYDVDIIGRYQNEREQLDGQYVDTPVVLSELEELGQLLNNRLSPLPPATSPVRISQFDGTPLITTDNEIAGIPPDPASPVQIDSEQYRIGKQADRESWLQNGFGGTSPTITPTTFIVDAITPATTQITVETTVDTENAIFAVGDTFVAIQGGNQVGILVTNIVSQINGDPLAGTCSGEDNPPQLDQVSCEADNGTWTPAPTTYEAVLDIIVLGGLSLGASGTIDETWAGFSNTDRTNKTDATDGYTAMLLDQIDELEAQIDARIAQLNTQKTELQANSDPNLDSQAETDVDASLAVLNAWKVDTDVDDTELTALSNERSTRGPQITARITAIGTAITTPTNFYDARYNAAVDKSELSRGTSRIKWFKKGVGDPTTGVFAQLKAQEEARIQAIEDILTLAGEPIPEC